MVPPTPGGSSEPQSQVKYIGLINIIGDPAAKEDAKLQAVQELSENFESIMNSSQYPSFLDYAIKTFMKFLLESKPHYVSEVSSQQVRKLLLELIYRFPTNKYLKAHVDSLLAMTFKLLKYENEQNMLVCLRIIIELHKHYRPPFNVKIQEFLKFVKTIYMELPENINKIFMPKGDIRIKELTDLTMDELLLDTFTTTPFKVDKKNADGSPATDSNSVSYSLIPKGVQSLKVLHELPLIVVLMYEHYKENVKQEVTEYIPIIIKTITLHPSPQIRAMANFNKEVFVDFMGVQIKCLSFLAYIIKVNQETVGENSEDMVEGMLSMLSLCPHQVTHLRKELLIAARHILATDLKHLFVPHMGRLFDEDILLGRGWTTHESLRPLAYNTLADLVHHVKQQLPLSDLIKAVHLFSKNVHDETLPTGIQTVSCKLLLNLVECIWQQSEKDPSLAKTTRELLMRMLHVFVLKFKVIAKLHLPILIAKSKQLEAQQKQAALAAALAQQQAQAQALAQQQAATQPQSQAQPAQTQAATPVQPAQTSASTPVPPIQIKKEEPDPEGTAAPKTEEKEVSKSKFGFPQSQSINYSITEYRNLVRTLVCGVKTITFRFKETIKERDTEIFIKLVKWALQALDIYTLSVSPPSIPAAMVQRPPQHQTVRTKDEKEVLEHFSGVFSVMDPQTFREIFSATIDYMVERIFNNLALQIICNSFLSSATTSPIFASVLVEYLLGRMSEMGNGNIAWSNLYLKLFKLVFGSVKMFAAKNEHMLRPHLHQIVNRSMELAMTAKEPFNYFLLLRTLFRSIGGGNHDLLYQEFLPLLPNLLQGLNSLQSGLHKQHMKDLFVELCLTVPVRLSSLLPYLPMLMDPLVSALNGSNILVISQGLRTLELCVDNLQPDFLYEHIQPVRAELMQALWRSLRSQDEELAQAAFRVLGKFGGGNRKMMAEPQKLEYVKRDFPSPSLMISFPEHTKLVQLPLEKVITTAVNTLKPCNVNIYYRKQCWEVVKHYIIASMNFDDDINLVEKLFNNPSFKIDNVLLIQNHYLCEDKVARQTLVNALSGMFFGCIIKDLNDDIQTHFDQVIKQFTLVAISQQAGPVCQEQLTGMDAYVLIDAIAIVMAHDEKELCKPAKTAIHLILNTAISILGSKDKACQLDYFKYMAERMCALCYERAWYTKLGGCLAILYLYESMSIRWLYLHLVEFVKAQLFVIMDLTGEVSSGAIDQASSNLETLIKTCAPMVDKVTDPGLYSVQHEALAGVMCELIRLITSPTDLLREQSMHLLKVFADAQGKSIVEVMEPHKAMIPPKKHLLRHQAANAQIGLMEGNTFCTTLTPRLFSLDLKEPDHNTFFHEVLALCEASDASLSKYPCYKNLSSLVPLRKAALRALASCHYLTSMSSKIFDALYQSLDRSNQQLQEAAFDALKTFVQGAQVDMNMVVEVMRPLLTQLGDFRNLNHNGAQRLSYLVQLFPNSFNEKLCDQLLLHLSKITDAMLQSGKSFSKDGESEKAMAIVIGIFGQIPAATAKFVEPLTQMVLQMEKDLLVGVSSPFRKPLLKFQLKFPKQTINLLLSDNNIKDEMWSKYLEFLIKSDDGKPFRDVLQSQAMVDRLITLAMVPTTSATLDLSSFLTPGCKENVMFFSAEEGLEVQYQSMRVVSLLIKFDDQWISTQHHLAQTFRQIWSNDQFLARHKDIQKVEYKHWKEPKLLVKILLNYYSHHPDKIDLLYSLLRAFCERLLPDFQFLRTFLEMTVAQSYTLEWKRAAFFKFVELFHSESSSSDLKAKIIQLVMIPCFAVCFERGEGDKLIGSAPQPNEVYDEKNIISVFIFKVIDPENPFALGDAVRITLLQLSCLLVEQGLAHIHDAETMSQAQGTKLRRIMTYAWPCLLRNNCVDPATRYHGHLLFAHVISKFAIHTLPYKRIVLQVFNSLLKAHAVEVRGVVRQALEILTPAMPARMVGGYTMLTHWTKKIIVEEGHLMQQLFHILQLIVRHYLVYYPVRHHLISHMVNALQRLAFSNSSSIEHRKLAVELAEIIIRWEVQRIKEEAQQAPESKTEVEAGQKRSASESEGEQPPPKKPHVYKSDPSENRPLDRIHVDAVLNFLARLACQVNEPPQPGSANVINTSPGEVLSRRCYHLIRMALKPDVWNQQLVDIRVAWMDKLLATVGQSNANLGNICIALELLTFLITVMKEEQILYTCKPLQKGLNACISSNNNKVIRVTHVFLTRLMSIFPTEPCASTVSSKHEELECIYSAVGRVVYEGLDNYEKSPNANSASLFGTVMMLKAACAFNPSYVDRLINHFVRVIHRMSREHMAAKPAEQPPGSVELLILSLDLVKNRVGVMTGETKKTFIGSILVGLIEKTQEIKVMKAICSMVEEWMKNTKVQPSGMVTANTNCGPTLREKSILLVKLMQYVEKRFPDLNTQFLELVNYIYKDETFKNSELIPKLEPAFLAGLRCTHPQIREKFFEIFDNSIRRRIHDRLMYIVSSQNWEPMGHHYWLKQCIELILVSSDQNSLIQLSSETPLLPSVTSVVYQANTEDRESFLNSVTINVEPMEIDEKYDPSRDIGGIPLLSELIADHKKFTESCKKVKAANFLRNISQLCHHDTALTEKIWLDIFPRLWQVLSDRQRAALSGELLPFLVSGVHVTQKDIHPSSVSTIFEALSNCNPPIQLKPGVMSYLGKSHNLWHRVTLGLEKILAEQMNSSHQAKQRRDVLDCYDFEPDLVPHQAGMEHLAEMYSQLREEDMWVGLWTKHCRYKETAVALAYEQQGYFEKALGAYELVLGKGRQDFINTPAPLFLLAEERLWEKGWIRCSKELNQWKHLLDYAKTKGNLNPYLILESAWRIPDWDLMKEAINHVETSCPKDLLWKVHLYRGYLAICHPDEQHLPIVERYVELASSLIMKEWRRLPHVVSHIHLPLLQAAQQIMELQEACLIHQALSHDSSYLTHEQKSSLHDMKAIVKTWRNRLPIVGDDLCHWSDIFTWRQHHYQYINDHYVAQSDQGTEASTHSMFGVHSSVQALIHFAKIARKHNLTRVCLDLLARIYTIPQVPIKDCFQKIRQQLKCYLQMALQSGNKELQEGLEVAESTNLNYFTKEVTSEFYALKGKLFSQMGGRSEDANKAFSAAVQQHDTLVKAWAFWGDFIEEQFTKSPNPDIQTGVCAITCFLHACRHQNESKSRKYLAKVLWLLTYDDANNTLAAAVDKYVVGVPPVQWLPWIPQLLTCLIRSEGNSMLNLLSQVARMYPQAVYFPLRTLYLTLKIEQMERERERYKNAELAATLAAKQGVQPKPADQGNAPDGSGPIKATPAMWRCSKIMQKDIHPTVLSSLEGLVDQMVWFRETWYEEVLRQLRQGLTKCYVLAFENRGAVTEATITPHTLHFVKKLKSTFGLGIENPSGMNSSNSNQSGTQQSNSSLSESLAKRYEVTLQDPIFQPMKEQFSAEFDFTVPGAMKLQNLIQKLKKWIKILEAKTKLQPKSFLIEEKCRFLSNFTLQTAEMELPGEFLLPKHSHYFVRISRFMPRVEIVQKHNTAARRLYIRGHNGKIYPYLVVNDSGLGDARREERVLQLLRMINHYFPKQKETAKRLLQVTVPRVVAVLPQMRLVEDNPCSLSLLDIYRSACSTRDTDHDAPVTKYYDKLASIQARGMQATLPNLKEILKDVQTSLVPKTLLKEWAVNTYPSPTDYWTFRKMVTLQLSLACFCEYVLHLTRLNPDMMYLHQDSGLLNVSYFKFNVDDMKGELDANRPVPFRLTPNIQELLTDTGINGPLTASMIAAARCLSYPNFKVTTILKAILRDEMIFAHKKQKQEEQQAEVPPGTAVAAVGGEQIIKMVTNAVDSISDRLNSLANFDDAESKVTTLVVAARNADNLCRMDPAWHPWL